jgi:flagellar basal body-associated protein FliL
MVKKRLTNPHNNVQYTHTQTKKENIMLDTNQPKDQMEAELKKDIEAYLAAGGKITVVPPSHPALK